MLLTSQLKTCANLIPQYFLSVLLIALFVLMSSGCGDSKGGENETTEVKNVALKITVVDQKGLPVEGVGVSSELYEIESTQYNALKQLLVDIPAEPLSGVIKLSKSGYLDGLLFTDGIESDSIRNVTLLPRGPVITFDGSLGGKFASKDGAIVDIPESTLVNSNGDIVFGPVDLYITPLDISDDIEVNAFPGSFSGMPTNQTETELLYSYGVVEYSFFQNGEELQLLSGTQAELELPIYASQHFFDAAINVGDTIPLWTLDETSGIWIQEGMGTVVENEYSPTGLALRGSTTHFSWFNADGFGGPGGGTPSSDPDNEGPCTLTVLFEGLLDNTGYELVLNQNGSGFPATTQSYSFVYSDPQSQVTQVPRSAPMRAKVVGPILTADDRFASGESGSVSFLCAPGDEEIIITLSLEEIEPEFQGYSISATPVFTNDNGLYEILSNDVYIGGYFIGVEQVEISTEILGFPLFLPSAQFFIAEYLKSPTHPSPTTVTATLSNSRATVQEETTISYIDSAPPMVFDVIAYHRSATSDTLIKWFSNGADKIIVHYINPLGAKFLWAEIDGEGDGGRGEFVLDLYPSPGQLEVVFQNQYGDNTQLIPLFQINPDDTD